MGLTGTVGPVAIISSLDRGRDFLNGSIITIDCLSIYQTNLIWTNIVLLLAEQHCNSLQFIVDLRSF